MIKCLICGAERKMSIVEHLKSVHNMSSKEYKEKYNAEYRTEEFRKSVSEQQKKVWSDPEYKERMCKSRQISHRTEEFRKKQSKIIKKTYENGHTNWNSGLTKEEDERLKSIGEKNRQHLKGKKNPEHSEKMKQVWKKFKEEKPDEWEELKNRQKDTITRMIANGDLCIKNTNFKTGWYEGKNDKYYYASSLEEGLMKLLDEMSIIRTWTNKHGIRILYLEEEKEKIYIPDFLITLITGDDVVVETKGTGFLKSINTQLKTKAAMEIYGDNYFVSDNLDEIKEFLNEKSKN